MTNTYNFDSSGVLLANKVPNEVHTVSRTNGINGYLIVPKAGAFYENSLTIVSSSGDSLIINRDYILTHHWQQATDAVNADIYGSITIISSDIFGFIKLNYNALGGTYALDPRLTLEDGLIASARQYVSVDWNTAPTAFPPTPHTVDLTELTGGIPEIERALHNIASALRSPTHGVHYNDLVGVNDVTITNIVSPILSLITTFNDNINAIGSLIENVLNVTASLSNIQEADPGMMHQTIKLGNFTINFGYIVFPLYGLVENIVFNTPYTSTNYFTTSRLAFKDSSVGFVTDILRQGTPTLTGTPVMIEYTAQPVNGQRVLSYFSIGI